MSKDWDNPRPTTDYDFDPGNDHKSETFGAVPAEPKKTIEINGPEEILLNKINAAKSCIKLMEEMRIILDKAYNKSMPITVAVNAENLYHSLYYQHALESQSLQDIKAMQNSGNQGESVAV